MNTDFAHYNEEQLRKLDDLHSLLRDSDIGSTYLASLPEPRSVEEYDPPQYIKVSHSEPDLDTLVDIYRQQRVDKSQAKNEPYSTKITRKYPGYIVVNNNHDLVTELVGEINRIRDNFADVVKGITQYKDTRSEILHQVCPWLVTLQVSRNIRIVTQKIRTLGFTWQIPVVHKFTRLETVIDRLRRELTELKPDISLTLQDVKRLKQERIEEIMMLSALNEEACHEDEQLRKFRFIRESNFPAVNVNIRYTSPDDPDDLSGPYKLNFRAPLPLILFSEPGRFNPLKDYEKGERQKRGNFEEKYRSVLPRIGLVEVIKELA
ncbi:TPA: DNA replication protein [Klebsiella pneumoniae]|nr:DNA replication protein [Klebsiella pneumoniae]